MSNFTTVAKQVNSNALLDISDSERQILLNSQDWRELERLSLKYRAKSLELAALFYQKAESTFLKEYSQIEKDNLLFHDIDWIKYVNFFPDLQIAKYTKLKSIRRLYAYDIANGRLGKYLISQKQISGGINFFLEKIVKHSDKLFYLGYHKLLKNLVQLIDSPDYAIDLQQLGLNRLFLKFQLQAIENNLLLKIELRHITAQLQQTPALTVYQAELRKADRLQQQDIEKYKLFRDSPQYPKVGTTSRNRVAIAGKKNWFYIHEGSNCLIEYHTGSKQLSSSEIKQWGNLLKQRVEWHQARNIAYQHLFVPNKIAVYPEYYPQKLNCIRDRPIIQLRKQCQQAFLYPNDLFSEQKNNYRLYNKQDCHWNFWGCYFAYLLVCRSLGISPNEHFVNLPIKISSLKGDLGDKFGIRERILDVDFEFNSKISFDNKLINYCHQGSIRVLKNSKVAQGKMIIFGDSFSNPGFPNYKGKKRNGARLASLFAETLNEVHFVWTPWIDYDYIEREKPDFVLTEMAERFLVRVPDDRNHLPLEEFAAMRLNKYKSKAS